METHLPHMHHPAGNKFWNYFFEFFMLFLAVSLGFFVENLREHKVEKERADVLAKSLLEDLKKDTSALNSGILFSNKKIVGADEVLELLHLSHQNVHDTLFYHDVVSVISSAPFIATDGTYSQMKTSGTLRYFDQSLVNMMNAYDVQLQKSRLRDGVEDTETWKLADFIINYINFEVVFDIRFNKPITHVLYIKKMDNDASDKLINLVVISKTFRLRTLQEYKKQLEIAVSLIKELKRVYHPE